jgi:hypothetical protein
VNPLCYNKYSSTIYQPPIRKHLRQLIVKLHAIVKFSPDTVDLSIRELQML